MKMIISVIIRYSFLTTTDLEWVISSLIRRPLRREIESHLKESSAFLPRRDHLCIESISGNGEVIIEMSVGNDVLEIAGKEKIVEYFMKIFGRSGDGVKEIAENMRKNINFVGIRISDGEKTIMNIEISGKKLVVNGKRIYPESEQKTLEDIIPGD